MKPSKKSSQVEKFISDVFGVGRRKAIEEMKCVAKPYGCGKEVREEDFRSKLDAKEFTISGLCQNCQDKVFGT